MVVMRGKSLTGATVSTVGVAGAQRPPGQQPGLAGPGAGQGGPVRQVVDREGLDLCVRV